MSSSLVKMLRFIRASTGRSSSIIEGSARRRNGSLLFWTFVRSDAAGGFSLYAKVSRQAKLHPRSEVQVQLSAGAGVTSFRNWTALRLAGVESGEDNPLFFGGRAFA